MAHEAQHGRFVWTELLTRDAASALAFYPAALGWGIEIAPLPEGEYTMWTAGGAPHAGLFPIPAGLDAPPSWLPYVAVDDVDAAVVRSTEEGGTVEAEPREIAGVGRFAVLADPAGAPFAVYRPAEPPAPERPPAAGEFSWRELATSDIARACDFYAEMFGWERGAAHELGPAGAYQIVARHGRPIGGVYAAPPGAPRCWTSYVRVEDLEGAVAAVARYGGRVAVPPTTVPGGDRIAVCADREGAVFALHRIAPL